jgi:nicotinamidase-related amidase
MITTLDPNTALVVIDLQNATVKLPLAHPAGDIVANSVKLINAFRAAGKPVVLVNVNPVGAAWTKARKESNPVPAAPPAPDWFHLIPELGVQPSDILVTKHTWSAFYETALHEELQKRGVTQIVLTGISTSIGVEGTARAASERGYNIAFATDAMTDMVADAHDRSVRILFPRMGESGTTAEVLAHIGA